MPLAVTHVLLSIILVDLYRDYVTAHKKFFTLHTVLIAGIAGLLPDIDIPLTWILNYFGYHIPLLEHGNFTHTPFFGLLFLVPAIVLWSKKKYKWAMYFFVATFGIFLHEFLDFLLGGGMAEGIMFFWPLSDFAGKIHLLSAHPQFPPALDAIILLIWLYHEEVKHKIKDFI